MRLDEMIIKANADGKTYVNSKDNTTYSKEYGFSGGTTLFRFSGWEELPKRHLTVSEAEKELDCVIDTPNISKLFRPMSDIPSDRCNVIIVCDEPSYNENYCGYFDKTCWRFYNRGDNPQINYVGDLHWIDPADLIKLLPKE